MPPCASTAPASRGSDPGENARTTLLAGGHSQARPVSLLRSGLLPAALTLGGLFLFPWLAHTGPGFWGAGVCHRIVERSFSISGQTLPLCARCTGIYLAFFSTAVMGGRRRPAAFPPPGILLFLLLFLVLTGLDGLNSYLAFFPTLPHLYEPNNVLRLLAGALEGIALAGFLLPALHLTLWETPRGESPIPNLRALGQTLLVVGGLALPALWPGGPFLYLVASLSLAGLFLAMGLVNTLPIAVLLRRAGRVTRWGEAATLFAWGTFLAMLELAALSWLRYHLTGDFSYSTAALSP